MNNPEAFKEDEVRSIKFVVPGLPFGKQRPKVTVRKFTGSDGKEICKGLYAGKNSKL